MPSERFGMSYSTKFWAHSWPSGSSTGYGVQLASLAADRPGRATHGWGDAAAWATLLAYTDGLLLLAKSEEFAQQVHRDPRAPSGGLSSDISGGAVRAGGRHVVPQARMEYWARRAPCATGLRTLGKNKVLGYQKTVVL